MNERTLIERLNIPWPEHEVEEVTLPAWVIELCAEGAARIAALEAQLAETQEKLNEANDKLARQNEAFFSTGAVKVKPLEWRARPGVTGTFDAYTEIGHFILTVTDDGHGAWVVVSLMQGNYRDSDINAVKAAVQADYERRILAALEPTDTVPAINAKFETNENGIIGTKLVNVKRVEYEDDGSLTVVLDYWPEPASVAEPVAWIAADTLNSPHPRCVSSLVYVSQIDKDRGRKYMPLYTHPPETYHSRSKLEELAAENERLRKALERVPDQAGHWAYVHCRVHIGSEHEDELSEFVTQKVRSFVDHALAQEKRR